MTPEFFRSLRSEARELHRASKRARDLSRRAAFYRLARRAYITLLCVRSASGGLPLASRALSSPR